MSVFNSEQSSFILFFIFLIILFSIVMGIILGLLPGIIASHRKHPQALTIWLLTIFLGWTWIAWVACLIWALNDDGKNKVYVNHNYNVIHNDNENNYGEKEIIEIENKDISFLNKSIYNTK